MSLARLKSVDSNTKELAVALRRFVETISSSGELRAIYLFGSFATGKATAASDLDIACIVNNKTSVREFRTRVRQVKHFDWPSDIVVFTEQHFNSRKDFGGVCFEIASSGIELYPRWRWTVG